MMPAPSHDAEPCIICGAPIIGNEGHDEGCMADPTTNPYVDDGANARARARAYADLVRAHDGRANEARTAMGYAVFDALRSGVTSGELAIDTGFSRQYVEKLARQAWRQVEYERAWRSS